MVCKAIKTGMNDILAGGPVQSHFLYQIALEKLSIGSFGRVMLLKTPVFLSEKLVA